jgi:FHS family L-fucose permease-like MFS transporter
MGSPETATRRLNLAQSFNPIGAITGILLSQYLILGNLHTAGAAERAQMSADQLATIQAGELNAITTTYLGIGVVLVAIFFFMLFSRMPKNSDDDKSVHLGKTFGRLIKNKLYRWGVVAQFFYVGAQIGVWSFTIRIVMSELNIDEKNAATIFLISMIVFTAARFVFTFLMRYIKPSKLIIVASMAALACTAGVLLGSGMFLVVCLVSISFFMSLMFPTIYGFALDGLGDDAKIGASGLIMAILGGAVLVPLQGYVSDATSSINLSYLVPFVCFIFVLMYGFMAKKAGK